ncbi:GspH/FimT family pseudopilin [Reinekea sp.]|jgi:type IV fimbrial biogenesis protein FimT|uniref:GspH/FimT family pseudopilin n=1 Tax=Reinekea sp. TaxID=1970455 RepID=UPI002A83CA55|nr:GspH/FimT family pseudopilin [Reinekea sp.]
MQQVRGFTLLELVVTVVILGIIAAYAAPSFDRFIRHTRIASSTSKIHNALNYGRSEAVNQGANVTVCSSTDDQHCNGDKYWQNGWIVFLDLDTLGTFDGDATVNPCIAGNDCVLRVWDALPSGAVLLETHGERFVTFTEQGAVLGAKNFSLELKMPQCGIDELRALSLNAIGRPEVSTGDCP